MKHTFTSAFYATLLGATLALNACGAWLYEQGLTSCPMPKPWSETIETEVLDENTSKRRTYYLTGRTECRSDGTVERVIFYDTATGGNGRVAYFRHDPGVRIGALWLAYNYDIATGARLSAEYYRGPRGDVDVTHIELYDRTTGDIKQISYYRDDETLESSDVYDIETGQISDRTYYRHDETRARRDYYDLTTSQIIGRFYYDRQEKLESIETYDPKTGERTGSATATPGGIINIPKSFRTVPPPRKPDLKDWI